MSSGDDVLDWFRSRDAFRVAAALLRRRRLSADDATLDDVLADASVAVLARMRSPRPLVVDNPAAYGTAVVRSVVRRVAQGRDRLVEELPGDIAVDECELSDPTAGDALRVAIESRADGTRPWLTSALLTYLTLSMHPDALPPHAPRPRAGSAPHQARCWPALWMAGERSLFPSGAGDACRKARSRRIGQVMEAWGQVLLVAGFVSPGGGVDG